MTREYPPAPVAAQPRHNLLLRALPGDSYQRLVPHLELVTLSSGEVICPPNAHMSHVYFPADGIVSLLYTMKNGASAEMAVVGNEGIVGVAVFMGGETMPSHALVQTPGRAFRLKAELVKEEFGRGGLFQYHLLRYAQALISQIAQTAACNRHHTVDQQLSRCLLLSLDRLPSNVLSMTQELIANMLGVRREGVTEAAGKLRAAGLIVLGRGRITVIDRPGLEQHVCECYGIVRAEFDRLIQHTEASDTACA